MDAAFDAAGARMASGAEAMEAAGGGERMKVEG
jgi:hypothetical protein